MQPGSLQIRLSALWRSNANLGPVGLFDVALLRNAALCRVAVSLAHYDCFMQVNEFCKRVRALRIHMLIVGHLRKQMPALMGKKAAQERLLKNLAEEFGHVQREHHLPPGALTSNHSRPVRGKEACRRSVYSQMPASWRCCQMLHIVVLHVMSCDIDGH